MREKGKKAVLWAKDYLNIVCIKCALSNPLINEVWAYSAALTCTCSPAQFAGTAHVRKGSGP